MRLAIALMFGAALVAAACAPSRVRSDQVDAIAIETPPPVEPYQTTPVPTPLLPRVESRGECAPRYRNGESGSCVDDTPCRGFAVRDGERTICACFVTRGGCAADERCEPRQSRCVKEEEPPFNVIP